MVEGGGLYSFAALWRAYRACRSNKRNTLNALAFEIDAEAQLLALQNELRSRIYQPGRSICFVTDGPKPREVFAADFRDRVVHHLLVPHLEAIFEPRFIHDSYACRPGKGVLAASDRLTQLLRQVTANGRRPGWALKLDVARFFPSIHKQTLYAIIARHVRNPELLWLTRVILFHDPTADYVFKAGSRRTPPPSSPRYPVPSEKSLFGKSNAQGLPIGNLTSQFWANVYLNEVDQFVKRVLRCCHYVRYVDDMVLLADDPQQLVEWKECIAEFAGRQLRLTLRQDTGLPFRVQRGVMFVGWKTWWSHRVPRRQTLHTLRVQLRAHERQRLRPLWDGMAVQIDLRDHDETQSKRVPTESAPALLQSILASYAGHLRHGTAWALWQQLWQEWSWLDAMYRRDGWTITARWPQRPLCTQRFTRQYAQLIAAAPPRCLIFCPVGRFIEFRGPQRVLAERVLGLRRAYLPRAGFAFVAGFPRRREGVFAQRAVSAGFAVVRMRERAGRVALRRCPARVAWNVILPSGSPAVGPAVPAAGRHSEPTSGRPGRNSFPGRRTIDP